MKPAPTSAAHPAAILAIILVSYFMILLDNSVIFTALPKLQAELRLSTSELSWVQGCLHAGLRWPAPARSQGR